MATNRVTWNGYFMAIAEQVASRSTCGRKHIGAVIVRDKTILSTGLCFTKIPSAYEIVISN